MVTDNKKLQGFADRLNEKLDEAGAPGWDKGRQKWAADFFKKEFKISEIGIRKWMMAEGMPDTKKLDVIATKLKTTVNYLLSGKEDTEVKETEPKYTEDREDLHKDLEQLQPEQLHEVRLLLDFVMFRKSKNVTAMKKERRKT
jgi:hypothetical protein